MSVECLNCGKTMSMFESRKHDCPNIPVETCVYCGKQSKNLGLDVYGSCCKGCHNKRVNKDQRNMLIVSGVAIIILVVLVYCSYG